jgi:DNA-binding MarR family transcriptional regulator
LTRALEIFLKKSLDNFAPLVHMHTMAKKLDLSAIENCVCFNLRWVTRGVTRFFDAEMRRHGIRPTQGSILAALNAQDSWTMAELSDWLGMERTTLVRNLRPLQRDGLVEVGGGGRGRLVELAITAKGRKQMEKLTPAWRAAQSAVVKTLGEKRWSAVLSDLETAALALNK